MANNIELIPASELPVAEGAEIDVLCIENGELKRKEFDSGVKSVNGIEPDDSGNVEVNGVKSVNGIEPDDNGNVKVSDFYFLGVSQVDENHLYYGYIRPDLVDAILNALSKKTAMPNVNINYWSHYTAVGVYYDINCNLDSFDKNKDYATIGWFTNEGNFIREKIFATQEAYDEYEASQS